MIQPFCRIEKQLKLDGTVPHRWREGFVLQPSQANPDGRIPVKVYKRQCLGCGFVQWIKPSRIVLDRLEPFSLY